MRKRRPDCASSKKKKNQHGPGAAAPQHAKIFDFQPRGVFVFFPISDIRYRPSIHRQQPPRRSECTVQRSFGKSDPGLQ
jgi:hypothetical protein